MKKILSMLALLIGGCTGIPENIQPVTGFEVQRYLGKDMAKNNFPKSSQLYGIIEVFFYECDLENDRLYRRS